MGLDIPMRLQLEKAVTVPKSQVTPKFPLPTIYGILMALKPFLFSIQSGIF